MFPYSGSDVSLYLLLTCIGIGAAYGQEGTYLPFIFLFFFSFANLWHYVHMDEHWTI